MRYPNVTSLYFATSLAFNALPRRKGSPRTICVKFCTEEKGWLRYKMAKKYCRKFQPPLSRAHERYRRQTDNRRQTDLR